MKSNKKYKSTLSSKKVNDGTTQNEMLSSGIESNLPEPFLIRMKQILSDEYDQFVDSLGKPKQSAIFVNKKIDVEYFKQIVDFDIEPIKYEPKGFYVNQKLGKHPLHHAGAFYVQEPSAMFTVNAHEFKGDEMVLDMCSAPGGKTIQIANRLPNGVLVSNEINRERCSILFSNIERMGLENVVITNDSPKNIANAYANCFDVVLVDAPCSGEGMFRRGEQVVKEWNKNLPQMCAERQQSILENANIALKQNGFLIYSTCTYSLEENEDTINKFIAKHNYKLVNIDENLPRGINMPEAVRLYPHRGRGEGQFVAVLQKLEENTNIPEPNMRLKENANAKNFVASVCEGFDCCEYGDFYYAVNDRSMIKKNVNYYSIGVRVGTNKDKRFEPCHNLFTAFGDRFKLKLDYDFHNPVVAKYLKGETFDVDLPDGYGAFLINGCAVGGFKISAGKFKNYYPKGLRNQ